MNYIITDIEDFRKEYPDPKSPEVAGRFKSLEEYLTIAKKVIKTFGPDYMSRDAVKNMLNSEDAISEIARHIMMADWGYNPDKGRTEHSYRNQCGIWAIQDYMGLFGTKANKLKYSLDKNIGSDDNQNIPLSSITTDTLAKEACVVVKEDERKLRVKKYIKFLIQNSNLTDIQRKCITLRYIDEITSHAEIGKMFDPPKTRQAIKQTLDRSLYKLRQTAKGTKYNAIRL